MKRLLPFLLLLAASPVHADVRHKITNSTQVETLGAYTSSSRVGSTFALSTSGMTISTMGGLSAGSATAAPTLSGPTVTQTTAGAASSINVSFLQGDAIPAMGSGVDVASGVIADMPCYGSGCTVYSGGVAGNLAGTVTSTTATITAGGAGTSGVASISSELLVD